MDSLASAALASWTLNTPVSIGLLLIVGIYVRGWRRGRKLLRDGQDSTHLICFLAGLAALFLAVASPLNTFDGLFLSAHMTQHLLLMMVAPPLILLGHPTLPLLRGLPKRFVKEGLGPFLSWPFLQRVLKCITSPPFAFLAFAASMILWHLPKVYELALHWPAWHKAQHACFFWTGILFWWPVVQPGPQKARWPRWAIIPYLLLADILNTILSAFFVFSGRLLYPAYEAVSASSLRAQDDQTVAGLIMWGPGSLIYLIPAMVIAVRLFSSYAPQASTLRVKRTPAAEKPSVLKRYKLPQLRRVAQAVMLALAITIMADGFFGTQAAPLNLAGVLPWIHWRALSVLALLIVGNLFCMVCPFTFVRDLGRVVLPAKLRWPRRLRTKWLPIALLLTYLWSYEAFGLWNSPWLTAWVIAGYFLAALLIDGIFRGASFCKYVCPIGQFHFVSSLVSPREIAVRNSGICKSCRTHDCIRGNERVRGCELYLFQPKKAGNLDCTFCLDCVKACPHDNIGLIATLPASTLTNDPYRSSIGRLSKRTDLAVLALIIVFGAFANAAGMVSPVAAWDRGYFRVAALIIGGALLVPIVAALACMALNRLTDSRARIIEAGHRFVFAWVPIGFAMWAAHLLYHLATTLPGASLPTWLAAGQMVILDAGLLLTLYVGWRIAAQYAAPARRTVALLLPWATVSCALYAAGVWILFQPMQMRGMMP